MIGRHQRCTLPAHRHVIGTQIIDNIYAQPFGQPFAIPQLHRQCLQWPVQNGLPVKADHIHIAGRKPLAGQKSLHGRYMPVGQVCFELSQITRPVAAQLDRLGRFQRQLEALAKLHVVSGKGRSAAPHDSVAIRFEHRQIDAIHRRAAHQPDGPFEIAASRHHLSSLLLQPLPHSGNSLDSRQTLHAAEPCVSSRNTALS